MSKVVSAVGNAVSSVVKGVVNVVKSVASGVGSLVKSIASSPLGKAVLIAGAVYFGGAALAGGFGSSAAGGSFLSGMGAGVSSAASSLSSAWGSVLAGNVGEAAGTIGNAWGTAGTAAGQAAGATAAQAAGTGAMTVSPTAAPVTAGAPTAGVPTAAANGGVAAAPAGWTQTPNGLNVLTSEMGGAAGGAAKTAAAGSSIWSSPYTAPALISAGTQVVGGVIQGAGQQKAMEDQRAYEQRIAQEARDRYNANVGARLWGEQPVNPATGQVDTGTNPNAWDPVLAARAINERYGAGTVAGVSNQGLISRNLGSVPTGTPMASNNYPVYNPYYAGRG
jgi:hypothetical protein